MDRPITPMITPSRIRTPSCLPFTTFAIQRVLWCCFETSIIGDSDALLNPIHRHMYPALHRMPMTHWTRKPGVARAEIAALALSCGALVAMLDCKSCKNQCILDA